MSAWHGDSNGSKRNSLVKKANKETREQNLLNISYKKKVLFSQIASICVGSLAGVGTLEVASIIFPFNILAAIGVSLIVTVIGIFFVFNVEKPRQILGGKKMLADKVTGAEEKIRKIEFLCQWHRNTKIGNSMSEIANLADDLLDILYDRPDKIVAARDFLGYYLDECISIIQKYKDMEEGKHKIEATKKIEESFASIETAFQNEIEKFKKNEAYELDLDIAVLKNDLRGKGIK